MTPLVKALLAVALVVPLVAYVAGSLAASAGDIPEQQGTVFISDAEPASTETSLSSKPKPAKRPAKQPAPGRPSPTGDNQSTQAPGSDPEHEEARVVTPAPVEDEDDERDDGQDDDRDDDRDDTDDGDESDGAGERDD